MRPAPRLLFRASKSARQNAPLLRIHDATFYRQHPRPNASPEESLANCALFPNLDFVLPSSTTAPQHWAVIGPSNAGKSTFLEILQGKHLAFPPTARTFPHLGSDEVLQKDARLAYPGRAIKHVAFGGGAAKGLSELGTYLSARYESRREETDFSVLDFLLGNTQLNPADDVGEPGVDRALLDQVVGDLRLEALLGMPVTNLSNGQSRRARIAKALLARPELLLLDEPFMGLDPPTTVQLSPLLHRLSQNCAPRLLLSLRPQDPIPDWITHIAWLGEPLRITHQGERDAVIKTVFDETNAYFDQLSSEQDGTHEHLERKPLFLAEFGQLLTSQGIQESPHTTSTASRKNGFIKSDFEATKTEIGEPLIEMQGVKVRYGDKVALGDWSVQQQVEQKRSFLWAEDVPTGEGGGLWWTVRRGERWAVCGANGSGKTTLLALLLSDHPQAYSAPMRIFGRSRVAEPGVPGISVFDIQRRIGHSSPEVHAFFPKHLSVRSVLESAYADTPLSRPQLTAHDDERVSACLRWFQAELNPSLGMYSRHREDLLRPGAPPELIKDVFGTTEPGRYRREYDAYTYEQRHEQEMSVDWADTMRFSELTFSAQRVALFLRAIVAQPDVVILDEAFGGMDDMVRDKCLLFLEAGESRRQSMYKRQAGGGAWQVRRDRLVPQTRGRNELRRNGAAMPTGLTDQQALIVVSHVRQEIPQSVRDWMFLPEAGSGEPCRFGKVKTTPLRHNASLWNTVWMGPKGNPNLWTFRR